MADRLETERLLRGLYAARVSGDLERVCGTFDPEAKFQIAGSSHASLLAMTAYGVEEFRPLLTIMIKSFRLRDLDILSLLVDGTKAAVHWRVKIYSKMTGETLLTELIDMIEVRTGRIVSFTELFTPLGKVTSF